MGAEEPGPPPLVAVVVTYNNERDIVACLGALVGQLPAAGVVVVVDNDSTDRTATLVETQFPQVRLIRSSSNVGFARACNRAAAVVGHGDLLFLNPDTEVQPGCIEAITDLARRRPEAGLYGGRALDAEGRFDPRSCWGRPTWWSLACFATGLSSALAGSERFNPEGMGAWRRDRERDVDVISGCLLLVRREVWDQLDGFDEDFFMYGEDADLAVRAHELGYRPLITPGAVVRHEVGASSPTVDKNVMLFRGKATLVRKLWPGPEGRVALGLLVAGVGLRAALAGVARPLLSRLRPGPRTEASVWAELWHRRPEWTPGWTGADR